MGVGQKHNQAVYAQAETSSRRHAVFHRFQIFFVAGRNFLIAFFFGLVLLFESFLLVNRVVELGKGVDQFIPASHKLEPVYQIFVSFFSLSQGRSSSRIVRDKCRLNELLAGRFSYKYCPLFFLFLQNP